MRWSKYQKLAKDSRVGIYVNWHIGHSVSSPALERYVKQHVTYIAVRPWKSLDYNAVGNRACDDLVRYWVHYHVTNDNKGGRPRRMREIYEDGPEATVRQLIDGVVRRNDEEWGDCGHRVVIDLVIRHREVWAAPCELTSESFDLYIPPKDYTL